MRRPTLPLIAAAAVAGAIAIAVPALAASTSSPAAHAARARHCAAVIVISHHRRVRACLIPGPRGFTGFPGPRGATGKTGNAGQNGRNWENRPGRQAGRPGTRRTRHRPCLRDRAADLAVRGQSDRRANLQHHQCQRAEHRHLLHHPAPASIRSSHPAIRLSRDQLQRRRAPGVIAVNVQHPTAPTPYEVDTYAPERYTDDARDRIRVHDRHSLTRHLVHIPSP